MGTAVQSEQEAGVGIAVMGGDGVGDGSTGTRADSAPVSDGYGSLDADGTKKAYEKLNDALDKLAATAVRTLDQMVTYLAKMQSLLSQRGSERKKVLKKAGLPAWTEWAKAYAAKFDRSFRTVQELVGQFNSAQGRGTRAKARKRPGDRDKAKLDARQQAALVKAQLATSDLVAALEKGGDWQTPLAAYKNVAVSPAKLDGYMEAFSAEPDWKNAFAQLVRALEQCSDELPTSAKSALQAAMRLLGGKSQTGQSGAGKQSKAAAERLDQQVEKTAAGSADGQAEHQAPSAPTKRRSVKSMTVNEGSDDERTVEKGCTCKYDGADCEITEVFSDGTALLLRASDGTAVAGDPVPIRELRFIAGRPNTALKRSKSHEQKADGQAVPSEELSARPTTVSPALAPEEKGGDVSDVIISPGSRQGDFTRNAQGRWEYEPLPQRLEQSAGLKGQTGGKSDLFGLTIQAGHPLPLPVLGQ